MTSWTEAEVNRSRKQAAANAWRDATAIAEDGRRAANRIAKDYRAAAEEATEAAVQAGKTAEAAEVAGAIKNGMRSASSEVVAAIRK